MAGHRTMALVIVCRVIEYDTDIAWPGVTRPFQRASATE